MSTRSRCCSSRVVSSTTRLACRITGLVIVLGSVTVLSACGGGNYGYAPGPQYAGPNDVNCQFGTPCGNARGTRP